MSARWGYYAVRIGRIPGVYYDHETYMAQMTGFPFAQGKRFNTEDEAYEYLYEKADITEDPEAEEGTEPKEENTDASGDKKKVSKDGVGDLKDDQRPCACTAHSCEVGRGLIFNEMTQIKNDLKKKMEQISADMHTLVRKIEDILGEEDGAIEQQAIKKRKVESDTGRER